MPLETKDNIPWGFCFPLLPLIMINFEIRKEGEAKPSSHVTPHYTSPGPRTIPGFVQLPIISFIITFKTAVVQLGKLQLLETLCACWRPTAFPGLIQPLQQHQTDWPRTGEPQIHSAEAELIWLRDRLIISETEMALGEAAVSETGSSSFTSILSGFLLHLIAGHG